MAQALIETGYFNDKIVGSYYVRSNYTNWFGMGYNHRGYCVGFFTNRFGKWAIYKSSTDGIYDRFAWDNKPKSKYNPIESKNIDEYISYCAKNGYWVEDGRDAGYTKLLYDIIEKHNSTFNTLLRTPLIILACSLLLLK